MTKKTQTQGWIDAITKDIRSGRMMIEVDADELRGLLSSAIHYEGNEFLSWHCQFCDGATNDIPLDGSVDHVEFNHKDDCPIPGLWAKLK